MDFCKLGASGADPVEAAFGADHIVGGEGSFRVGGCCHSLADASTIHTAVPGASLAINRAGKRWVL